MGTAAQALKADVLAVEAELAALERAAFPEGERWTVFVTTDSVSDFALQAIVLQVDGETVAEHRYGTEERQALRERGAHRLHLGRLAPGRHRITTELHGRLGDDAYRRVQTFTIGKPEGPRLTELRLYPEIVTESQASGPGLVARNLSPNPS